MELLRASELADRLSLSRGRISQLVSEGKFEGCYEGKGRNRRFDLAKCVTCLERGLDFGQVHGNGAEAAAARQDVLRERRIDWTHLRAIEQQNSTNDTEVSENTASQAF